VDLQLTVTHLDQDPIVGKDHPGSAGNRFGYEGGTARKVAGRYYIFTTEVFDEPKTSASRLVLWDSDDGRSFTRRLVIAETNFDWNDETSHRMSPWSPMAVYDPDTQRWSVFHVAYSRKKGSEQPYNMAGLIGRHDSLTPGEEGICGPYEDAGFVDIDEDGDDWEGPAKLVSFYPFRVDGRWLAFYGGKQRSDVHRPEHAPQEDNSARSAVPRRGWPRAPPARPLGAAVRAEPGADGPRVHREPHRHAAAPRPLRRGLRRREQARDLVRLLARRAALGARAADAADRRAGVGSTRCARRSASSRRTTARSPTTSPRSTG
jgi:hypothetical protein